MATKRGGSALLLALASVLSSSAGVVADSTGTPPFVSRPSFKIPSTGWSVVAVPALLAASPSAYRIHRNARTIAPATADDTTYVVLPPSLRANGDPDPHTDTAWTWLIPGLSAAPHIPRDPVVLVADTNVTVPAQTIRWERDSVYYYGDRGLPYNNSTEETSGEGWYWTRLTAGSSVSASVVLPRFALSTEPSSLRLRLHSSSAASATPTHALILSVNGQRLDTLKWNGYQTLVKSVVVPTALLVRGANTIRLQSLATAATVNEVYVDWFELTAPQSLNASGSSLKFTPPSGLLGRLAQFDVEGSANDSMVVFGIRTDGSIERWPRVQWNGTVWQFTDTVVSGRSYILTPSSLIRRPDLHGSTTVPDLRTNLTGADHLIIAPRLLVGSANRLAAHRAAESNMRVAVVTVEDVVDAFGEGRWGPDAIRAFLLTVDTTWTAPAPTSILLFGDGTWDPLDHFRTGKRGLIPTLGNPVSDAMYVVDTLDRFRQRKAIGRIPVHTVAQADSVVDALIAYDGQPISRWNGRYLFFASGFDSLETVRFQQFSDALFTTHIAPAPLGGIQGRIYRTVEKVIDFEQTQEVRQTLDSGGVWINYYGHAGTDVWANGINRADQLANVEAKAHLITDISCSTARFAEPLVESFGEVMVTSTAARALAYIGSSGFGYESPLRVMAGGFYKAFAAGERRLGALHLAAKNELWKNGTSSLTTQQALHQWTLLGDPSARLRVPRWPEYEVDERALTVNPLEPSEQDSVVRVRCRIENIGLLTRDSVVVRLRVFSESASSTIDTVVPADRRTMDIEWDRWELRRPGFQTVTVTVNPDSQAAEESLSRNEAEIRYVVSTSRFLVMSPSDYSRIHPDSVRIVVLPPGLTSGGQTLVVELDSVITFNSPVRRTWSGIPIQPFATSFAIPAGILASDRRYFVRVQLVAGPATTPWITRTFSTGVPVHWIQDMGSGWAGVQASGVGLSPMWRLEDRSEVALVTSAGFSDGNDTAVWLDGINISQGFANRGYNVAVLNEKTGHLESFAAFSIYSDIADTSLAEPLIQHMRSIPAGRRVLIGVSDEGSKNKTERLNREMEAIGSAQIRSLGWRGSWAISGWKGAPIGTVPESRSNEGQGPVSVLDTIHIRSDSGAVISPAIGPAQRWSRIDASLVDTASGSRVAMKVIRSTVSSVLDTIECIPGSSEPEMWSSDIRSIQLIAIMARDPGQSSPSMLSWSVQAGGLAEVAVSSSAASFERDSVDSGIPLHLRLPVANVGVASLDSLPYSLRWRWSTGESNSTGSTGYLATGSVDTIRAELPTSAVRGVVEVEAVLDPQFHVAQWDRGNDVFRRQAFVLPDTLRPRFTVTIDGRSIVDGDYVRPQPEVRIEIVDDGAVPIASPSLVDLRLNGRRVSLSTSTPDSLFESHWSEKKAMVVLRPNLERGTHQVSVQVTDGSGNPADTSAFVLHFRVEPNAGIRNLAPYPNPFLESTDLTFNLTGQAVPEEGSVRVYTVAGRLIREIAVRAGEVQPGFNAVRWDGRDGDGDDVANGVYLAVLKLKAGDTWLQETAKLAKVR